MLNTLVVLLVLYLIKVVGRFKDHGERPTVGGEGGKWRSLTKDIGVKTENVLLYIYLVFSYVGKHRLKNVNRITEIRIK